MYVDIQSLVTESLLRERPKHLPSNKKSRERCQAYLKTSAQWTPGLASYILASDMISTSGKINFPTIKVNGKYVEIEDHVILPGDQELLYYWILYTYIGKGS